VLSLACDCSAVLLDDCLEEVSSSSTGELGTATAAAAAAVLAVGGDTDTDAGGGTGSCCCCSIAAVTFHISTAPSLPAVAKCLPV
jgi:hypothetical protein